MVEREMSWWQSVVKAASATWGKENHELQDALLKLHIKKEGEKLMADTPDGRREVQFSSVNSTPVIAYTKGVDSNQKPVICLLAIPGLPWHEITRGSQVNKLHWGGVEKLD